MLTIRKYKAEIFAGLVSAVVLCLFVSLTAFFTWKWALRDTAGDVAEVLREKSKSMQISSRVYDIRGQELGAFSDETRYLVPLESIPLKVKQAFLAAEDDGFYNHPGISLTGMFRALISNLKRDKYAQGGSTITQQVVRQFLLSREKSISRKLKEIILSLALERQMSKSEILEIWLNSVYLGNSAWGVETASRLYFDKGVGQLTLGEASILAGLPQAPSRYAPHLRPKAAKERQTYVLNRMQSLKWITDAERSQASSDPLRVIRQRQEIRDPAPWVSSAIRLELWRRLEQKNIPKSGLKITSTIDWKWQKSLQELVLGSFSNVRREGLELGIVVLDAKSGDIRSVVGGADFSQSEFNRALDLYRPLGAAVYPLIFVWGMERGIFKVDGYQSIAEAAVKSRFAEAEQIAPEIGYGLVRDKLMSMGFVVKDAMAIDELHGSPLALARAYLGISGNSRGTKQGLISKVLSGPTTLYLARGESTYPISEVSPSVSWVIRKWMALGAHADSKELSGQPLLKAIKGWNAWWIIPRDDVVVAAWVGSEGGEPKNPAAFKILDHEMDLVLSSWIQKNLRHVNGVGLTPEGISFQLSPSTGGKPPIRLPFVVSTQGVF